jgi:hypothetical protein
MSESVVDIPDVLGNPGNITLLQDQFTTYNRYYGGQVGLETETRIGPVVLLLSAKAGAGENREVVKISGGSRVYEPDGTVTVDQRRGLLVQPSNEGRFTRNQVSVVPELAVTLAWEFSEHVRASLGYNFLYWSNIVRPGDQIDQVVNVGAVGDPGQLGTSPHPVVPLHSTGFWAQGLSVGIQVSY